MKFGFARPKLEHLDRYLASKDYDKALTAVADELQRNPAQSTLALRKAEILELAGNSNEAVRTYRKVAQSYARDGFYAKAIALYKKVLRLDPELEEVHSELAKVIDADRSSKIPLEQRLRQQYRSLAKEDPEQMQRELKELQASALFAAFPQEALEEILSSTALRVFNEGDIIVTEGEQGSSLFLIVSGEVKVFTRGQVGEHLPLAELGPGDFFGEVSLLTGRPRTATITAKTPVTAIELRKLHVDQIAGDHPEVRGVLEDFYQRRAQNTVEAVIRRMRGEDAG
jgi:cAMP-dependent protein kinase regulator